MKKLLTGFVLFSFLLLTLLAPVSLIVSPSAPHLSSSIQYNVALAATEDPEPQDCIEGDGWFGLPSGINAEACFAKLLGGLLFPIAYVMLGLTEWLTNIAIDYALGVDGFRGLPVWESQGVAVGWQIFLGLANLVIIFILIFIGIATILRMEGYGYKQLLAKLIIVAILVNFSYAITTGVIDLFNGLALIVIQSLPVTGTDIPLGSRLVQGLKLNQFMGDLGLMSGRFLQTIFGFIFVMFASFGILMGTFMLLTRVVVFSFLVMLSPLALVAYITPKTSEHFDTWFKELIDKSIFAPIYFVLLAVAASIAVDGARIIGNAGTLFADPEAAEPAQFEGVVSFIIAVMMIYAAAIVAKKLGISGAEMTQTGMKWLAKRGGLALPNSMLRPLVRWPTGMLARGIRDSGGLRGAAARKGWSGFAARSLVRGLGSVDKMKIMGKSNADVVAEEIADRAGMADYVGTIPMKERFPSRKTPGESEEDYQDRLIREQEEKERTSGTRKKIFVDNQKAGPGSLIMATPAELEARAQFVTPPSQTQKREGQQYGGKVVANENIIGSETADGAHVLVNAFEDAQKTAADSGATPEERAAAQASASRYDAILKRLAKESGDPEDFMRKARIAAKNDRDGNREKTGPQADFDKGARMHTDAQGELELALSRAAGSKYEKMAPDILAAAIEKLKQDRAAGTSKMVQALRQKAAVQEARSKDQNLSEEDRTDAATQAATHSEQADRLAANEGTLGNFEDTAVLPGDDAKPYGAQLTRGVKEKRGQTEE